MHAAIPEFASPTLIRNSRRPHSSVRNQASSADGGSHFEAGGHTRRTRGWRAPTSSPNQGVLGNLATLRDRSRAATRNDGYAKGSIDKLVTNIVGCGIKPMSMAADASLREQINALWLRWTDEADADGLFDFYGLQTIAVRAWLEGGESFTRARLRLPSDGLSVPLQLQVLEPELCPHTYNHYAPPRRIRAGIEFSAIGKRVAYHFHPTRPELDDYDASTLRAVPAGNVVHLYDPLRPGQIRGIPHLTQALIKLYELDKFDDATLLRQQLANLFVAFVKRPTISGAAEELHPLTGAAPETIDGAPAIAMEPGITQELAPGEEMQFADPPKPDGYSDFMRQNLMGTSAATGVPYEVLTGDMRGVNDRTVRLVLNEFRRRIQAWQHQIVGFQFCRVVWRWWMDRAFFSRALPIPIAYLTDPTPWLAVKWVPQGWPYMHPVQDVQANKDAVRAGFKSRSAVVSELGEDAEVIDAEQAADNKRADEMGLKYDSDGRAKATPANVSNPPGAPHPAEQDEQTGAAA